MSNSEPFFICKISCKRPCKWYKNSGLHHVYVDACNGINDQRQKLPVERFKQLDGHCDVPLERTL